MNYSDYDSEDYSSNEDEDYVPSGEKFVLLAIICLACVIYLAKLSTRLK